MQDQPKTANDVVGELIALVMALPFESRALCAVTVKQSVEVALDDVIAGRDPRLRDS